MLNLDTHIFIHALNDGLTERERKLLNREAWSISAMVLWEISKLFQHGKIEMDIYSTEFSEALDKIHVWPLTFEIAKQSVNLDFKSDPADEVIAATSIVHRLPLLTRDIRIKKSRIVPLA